MKRNTKTSLLDRLAVFTMLSMLFLYLSFYHYDYRTNPRHMTGTAAKYFKLYTGLESVMVRTDKDTIFRLEHPVDYHGERVEYIRLTFSPVRVPRYELTLYHGEPPNDWVYTG